MLTAQPCLPAEPAHSPSRRTLVPPPLLSSVIFSCLALAFTKSLLSASRSDWNFSNCASPGSDSHGALVSVSHRHRLTHYHKASLQ